MERARPVCQFKPVAAQVMMGKQTIRPMSKVGLPRMMTKGKGDDQGCQGWPHWHGLECMYNCRLESGGRRAESGEHTAVRI